MSVLALLVPLLVASPGGLQEGEGAQGLSRGIEEAVARGVRHLLRTQNRDGSWDSHNREATAHWDHASGQAALSVYTLSKCGLPPDHPAIQRGVLYLLARVPTHTYTIACQLMALDQLGDLYGDRLEELHEALLEIRGSSKGGWGYPGHSSLREDLSNTVYAVLGLHAVKGRGFALPRKLTGELIEALQAYREAPRAGTRGDVAGFRYDFSERSPTGAMTSAALTLLYSLGDLGPKLSRTEVRELDEIVALGRAWLVDNYTVTANPSGSDAWYFYWLYGLERVGSLSGERLLGAADWYADGARELIKSQHEDGGWRTSGEQVWPPKPMDAANTCFALLFLKRATAPSSGAESAPSVPVYATAADAPLRLRASGSGTITAWLEGVRPELVERYSEAGGLVEGLRVLEAEWRLDGEVVATLEGDPSKGWSDERFALQVTFTRAGDHRLTCRLRVVVPGDEREVRARVASEWIETEELTLPCDTLLEDWMTTYASASSQNLLLGSELDFSASSAVDRHPAQHAADGTQLSTWLFEADDPAPRLELELGKGVRANTVLVSSANRNPLHLDAWARLTDVRLFVNKDKDGVALTRGDDDLLKLEARLPKTVVVRRLELRILGREAGREHGLVGGIAEIELERR